MNMLEVDEIPVEELYAAQDIYDKEVKEKRDKIISEFVNMSYSSWYSFERHLNVSLMDGVHFTEAGMCRAMHTVGWLTAMHQCKPEIGDVLILDFIKNIQRYSINYEKNPQMYREVSEHHHCSFPTRIISFSDDGTFGGFGFGLYEMCDEPLTYRDGKTVEQMRAEKVECFEPLGEKLYYRRIMYGGLLYHGPGCGQTFAVTLDPCCWSYHT